MHSGHKLLWTFCTHFHSTHKLSVSGVDFTNYKSLNIHCNGWELPEWKSVNSAQNAPIDCPVSQMLVSPHTLVNRDIHGTLNQSKYITQLTCKTNKRCVLFQHGYTQTEPQRYFRKCRVGLIGVGLKNVCCKCIKSSAIICSQEESNVVFMWDFNIIWLTQVKKTCMGDQSFKLWDWAIPGLHNKNNNVPLENL